MRTFGQIVRKCRLDSGLKLHEVAKKVGTHKGYVSGIENGKVSPPSVKFIKKFCRLFKLAERDMIMVAHVEKAPKEIRDELGRIVFGE
jgi:transcriptional regulator with XRE-family HTH domain